MIRLLATAGVLVATAACGGFGNQPGRTFIEPCPADAQYCVVQDDGGCTATLLVCCEGLLPSCPDGGYAAKPPASCSPRSGGGCA